MYNTTKAAADWMTETIKACPNFNRFPSLFDMIQEKISDCRMMKNETNKIDAARAPKAEIQAAGIEAFIGYRARVARKIAKSTDPKLGWNFPIQRTRIPTKNTIRPTLMP
jgi:hypothetical protein